MPQPNELCDLILATRLDVLEQAVGEVDGVIEAMREQSERLNEVEGLLQPQGWPASEEKNLRTRLNDARGRLEIDLDPGPRTVQRMLEPRRGAPPADREERLKEALECLRAAEGLLTNITGYRNQAYVSFEDVRRWSVAGLGHDVLSTAVRDYERLIKEIREAAHPWRRYQDELPRRGQELFARYVELLAGMAVRGFGLDADITSDVDNLIEQLLGPVGDDERPPKHERSPLALMGLLGKRHVPLGYPDWSLWALPLVGRTAGELVVNSFVRRGEVGNIDSHDRILCADLYAQYALGPSYLHASVFLEFDPSPEPVGDGIPTDSLRTSLLLENLLTLNGGEYADVHGQIADKVRTEWERARAAVTGAGFEVKIGDDTRQVVAHFLQRLKARYPEVAYDASRTEDIAGIGRTLLTAGGRSTALPKGDTQMREIITAMWLARMQDPGSAREIHEGAKALARQTPVLTFTRGGRQTKRHRPERREAPWVS